MEVGQDGVAIITLANPPVNALHPDGTILSAHRLRGRLCCIASNLVTDNFELQILLYIKLK